MTPEEIKLFVKETFFRNFERRADLVNHPQPKEETAETKAVERRIDRWTQEMFDYDITQMMTVLQIQ